MPGVLKSASVRTLIDQVLLADSEFEAFVLDYFPQVKRLYGNGMDRTAKVNILLEHVDYKKIYTALYQKYPQAAESNSENSHHVVLKALDGALCTHGSSFDSSKSRVNYYLVLSGSIEEANVPLVRAIADHLRKISGDAELTIETVRSGSIILHIKGTAEGLAHLTRSFESGELRDILGYPLQQIGELNAQKIQVAAGKLRVVNELTDSEICHISAGTVIADRYVLLALLGHGSLGEVWCATDALNEWRQVAVKVLSPASHSAATQKSFERELQVLGLVQHRHIVKLLAHGRHDGQPYMVTEYLNGGSLARYLRECKAARVFLPLSQVWNWFDQVCQALGAAHRLGEPGPLVHRYINPSNIMIAAQPESQPIVKVVGFEFARFGKRSQNDQKEPVGARGYMSPEQAAGDYERIHPSSDVFSLGLLLLEMLTLRVSTLDDVLFASIAVQNHRQLRVLLPQLRPDVPLPVWHVIEKSLQPKLASRYQDAEALRLALWRALDSAAWSSERPSSPKLARVIAEDSKDERSDRS